jgi:hypothetical protein
MQELYDQLVIYAVFADGILEGVQDRVQANALFDRVKTIGFKLRQQFPFVIVMETVYDLVGKPDKAINRINRLMQLFIQEADSHGKTGTVTPGRQFTAFSGKAVKFFFHRSVSR